MSDWQPRPGMAPSPRELQVLYALTRVWGRTYRWGATVPEVHLQLETIAAHGHHQPPVSDHTWEPSLSTVRDHLRRLEQKGLITRNRRPTFVWYAPTGTGRLALLDCIHPELSQRRCR